jgi:PAS domain S-box-containing protein
LSKNSDDRPSTAAATEPSVGRDAESFRLLVDSTVDYAIFLLDPDGRVASWNSGAERIKGYRADEIIGRHFSIFYQPAAVASGWPAHELQEATRTGRFEDEGWRVRRDGSCFWANVVITALRDPSGELRGFAKVTRDMSLRKAHEERIENLSHELQRRVDDLDEANRVLAQKNSEIESFVYSVSHDLRAPLVNLQGFSHELGLTSDALRTLLRSPGVSTEVQTRAAGLLDGEMAESLGYIRNAVRHLGNIIDGLLRLSRAGRIEYQPTTVDTGVLVAEILASIRNTVEQSGARIEIGPLPVIEADRNAVGQVFANLLGNALKSFDDRRPGLIQIAATDDTPPVFSVRDNGVGIPEEYRPKIFQVFQPVHPSQPRGEGMGLAIVRRIVERHYGRIWFETAADRGTTFFFTLAPAPGTGQ